MSVAPRSEKLDLRLSAEAKRRLVAAAAINQRSVSEFVLISALAQADEVLGDRQHFGLDAAQWEAFTNALDAPTRALPRMVRLLHEPSVFEAGEPE
ncbi:MAG: DUF1778 domain-containing protein [Thermomicrobiales bacterium]